MKFKVGDRVRCIDASDSRNGELEEGKIYIISQVDEEDGYVKLQGLSDYDYDPSRFEKIEYTYEDLKKSPIGTKITLEKIQDKQLVKTALNRIENDDYRFFIRDFEGLNTGNYGKIIKIEEPEYTKVYEAKVEILDDVEKRYLRGVIRPYLDRIESIEKYIFSTGKARIIITVKDDNDYWHINLPPFEKDTMYKNMKDDKKYTLEELGL